jgi:ACS family tartrate transporter-like MFS transporter
VLLLTLAYFCTVSASLGLELFLPSILQQWYKLNIDNITWLVILPPCLALAGQLFVGWNSDRKKERRLHCIVPVGLALITLALAPFTQGHLTLTILCFMVTTAGLKAYLPSFWALPSLFLTEAAAAASIGLINSIGNLGAFYGQAMLGAVEQVTGSFVGGLYYLCGSMILFIVTVFLLGLGGRESHNGVTPERQKPT